MTTNQGFRYTIERFRYAEKEDSDAVSTDVNANVDPMTGSVANNIPLTAAYKNSTIRDCHVRTIVIDLLRSDESRLPRNFWAWAATEARSTVGVHDGYRAWSAYGQLHISTPANLTT